MSFNINGQAADQNTFDVIVVGSGMSGGWAAKEFTEQGLQTLVLERGRDVVHGKDYPTAMLEQWQFPHRMEMHPDVAKENPVISRCYAYNETTEHFFVKDKEHPWEQTKPFDWIRGYQVGGKSLMWARMTQRWGQMAFEENGKDGYGVEWPISYEDLAPWYSHVEKFIGIQGNRDGHPQVPDGEFLPAMPLNCVEEHFLEAVEGKFPDRSVIVSRSANLSQAHNGRGACQYRSRCERGCPYGAYFSSNSSTLPAAYKTGNLTLRPFSVVHSVIYDEATQKATGVRVVDTNTKEMMEYYAKIIFLNAGTLNTTLVLLNSTSDRYPNGLGNDHDILGRYLMDHNYRGRLSARHDGFRDKTTFGRRPSGVYIPRFRNVGKDQTDQFLRGYAFSGGAGRGVGGDMSEVAQGFGVDFKNKMFEPGPWGLYLTGMGECLPYHDNRVTLSTTQTDQWGIPLLNIDCEYKENEVSMVKDLLETGAEMLEAAGFKDVNPVDTEQAPGLGIHEMGSARMGKDPKTSILNKYNQVHDVKNVFVTDGACMTSSSYQNPSLTYMALTARAANYAMDELKKMNL